MITYQPSIPSDCNNIAALHANSWQKNYRGVLDDNYLDNQVQQERLDVWIERFQRPTDNQHIITAKEDDKLVGFTCLYGGEHAKYGTYLDNLHVLNEAHGKGIGKELMKLAGQWSTKHYPTQGLYLFVFMANTPAIGFYERIGGKRMAIKSYDLGDGTGRMGDVGLYYWERPDLIK